MNAIKKLFTKNKNALPLGRKLPMQHVHTFRDGTRLFTYRPEDYTELTYRHYEQITELQRYIQAFGLTKSEWHLSLKKMREEAKFKYFNLLIR